MADVATLVTQVVRPFGPTDFVLVGLASWLGRVWSTRIAAKDQRRLEGELAAVRAEYEQTSRRLQAELDRTLTVHRAQIEVEVSAYRDTWSHVAEARLAFGTVRPIADTLPPPGSTRDELLANRVQHLGTAHNKLIHSIEANQPFLEQSVYDGLQELAQLCRLEHVQVTTGARGDPGYFQDGRVNFAEFNCKAESVATSIRKRLASLSVPGSP
jgi:hypothetical protein